MAFSLKGKRPGDWANGAALTPAEGRSQHPGAVAATLVIATSLSPAACERRIHARIDPALYRLRADPAAR